MLKKVILTIMASFFAVSALANAPAFGDIDVDKDGVLSQDEAQIAGINKELFAEADADKNGSLSEDEYATLTNGDK